MYALFNSNMYKKDIQTIETNKDIIYDEIKLID
jgi:hypothetical protein